MPAVCNEKENPNDSISLVAILEAILFLSSEPLTLSKLQEICNVAEREIVNSLEMLRHSLERPERGLLLLHTAAGFRLGTKPELAAFLEKLWEEEQISPVLSPAALETLAIIAVKQPVTRVEIEKIRGVNVDGVLENLLKRNLIKIGGRREGLGRPHLYITTEYFLQYFGLKGPEELENLLQDSDPESPDVPVD
ncbi:MAG: SMC-Scp complex subunit ScpB [Bacillota bacterium]